MTDFFHRCNIVESRMVADGLGGYEVVEYIGLEIEGLLVKKSSDEQLVGATRGIENTLYTFHTYANVPLLKDNKIRYNDGATIKYIRLTSSAELNADKSMQTDWKSYSAESYEPTSVIE